MTTFKETFERHYTWIEGFMRNVRRYPSRMAMIDPEAGKSWNYTSLNADVNRYANALSADGFVKGDVVMTYMQNCPEFAFTYITTQKLQGVCCPTNFRLSAGELAYLIDDSKPFALLYQVGSTDVVRHAVELAKHKPHRFIVAGNGGDNFGVSFSKYVEDQSTDEPMVSSDYNIYDETTRLYTSGTTGRPKGNSLTSINEVLSAHDVMMHFPMSYRDVTMNTTPWFHRGGLHCAGPCTVFYAGATLVIMKSFSATNTLKYVGRYGITFLVGVPTVLEELADEQERKGYHLEPLKGIVTMGSPLERSSCIRYQKVLTPNIFNGYGTTETFWNTFLRPFDLPENAGTAGASCVDDDVRVVKVFEDRKAEPDELAAMDGTEVGEVIICSPAKAPYQYYNNEEQSRLKFYKDFIYTGDLATWNEKQFITIVGRKDDMIISSGENIYPTEVEAALNTCPGVKDCLVTCVPDKVRGQMVTAYIVRSDASLTAEQLDAFCKQSPDIANFKRPRYYRFVEYLPMNATCKKLLNKAKEMAVADWRNGLLQRV